MTDWTQNMESAPHDRPIEAMYDDGSFELVRWEDQRCCILGSRAGAMGPGWQSCEVELPVGGGPHLVAWRPRRTPSALCSNPRNTQESDSEV